MKFSKLHVFTLAIAATVLFTLPAQAVAIIAGLTVKKNPDAPDAICKKAGLVPILNNYGTPAVWDCDRGWVWYISPDNQARTFDDALEHLDVLNGIYIEQEFEFAPLTDAGDLQLPTLYQLRQLAEHCVAAMRRDETALFQTNVTEGFCAQLWPDLSDPDNCAWSRSSPLGGDGSQGYVVCLTGAASPKGIIAIELDAGLRDRREAYPAAGYLAGANTDVLEFMSEASFLLEIEG